MYLKDHLVDCHCYDDKRQTSEDSYMMILGQEGFHFDAAHRSGARDFLVDLVAWADIALTTAKAKHPKSNVSFSLNDLGNACTDFYVAFLWLMLRDIISGSSD